MNLNLFTREQLLQARSLGWTPERLLELSKDLPIWSKVTEITSFAVAFGTDLLYKDRPISEYLSYLPRTTLAEIYVDGSGTTIDKDAGVGVCILEDGQEPKFIAEYVGKGTNNYAELQAIHRGLKAFPDATRKLLIISDSAYAIGSVADETWVPKTNIELIQIIREDLALRRKLGGVILFKHVNGHVGVPGNEACDALAKWGRKYGQQFQRG